MRVRSRLSALALAATAVVTLVGPGTAASSAEVTAPVPAARAIDDSCPLELLLEDGFRDIAADSQHENAIDCVVQWRLASGRTITTFAPADLVTREQMATFLGRMITAAGGSLPTVAADHFDDDAASAHQGWINRLADAGIVGGTTQRRYEPLRPVTRGQMARLLTLAHDYLVGQHADAGSGTNEALTIGAGQNWFADDDGHLFEADIDRAAAAGITGGQAAGSYGPGLAVRREQMAAFLARTLDLVVEQGMAEVPVRTSDQYVLNDVACTGPDSCVAVGTADGGRLALVQRWDGAAWSVVPSPTPSGATAAALASVSCSSIDACMAVGSYTTETGVTRALAQQWDGRAWTATTPPDPSGITNLMGVTCTSAARCVAVGSYGRSSGWQAQPFGLLWDGGMWSRMAGPQDYPFGGELRDVACASDTMCLALGWQCPTCPSHGLLLRWDGTSWAESSDFAFGTRWESISCLGGTCALVGWWYEPSRGRTPITARLHEGTWTMARPVSPEFGQAELHGVSCLPSTECLAVGSTDVSASPPGVLVERLSASGGWTTAPSTSPSGAGEFSQLTAVSCSSDTDCVAVGVYRAQSPGPLRAFTESFDGTTWTVESQ